MFRVYIKMISSRNKLILVLGALCLLLVISISSNPVSCAPTSNNGNNNQNSRPSLLSNLFRRQTGSSSSSSSSNENSNSEPESDDPQTQTELEAQKFMDSLPGSNSNNSGPSSFRERVSDTFGVLRDGVSNHFRSMRDNFSDTVEDLRDTWSSATD